LPDADVTVTAAARKLGLSVRTLQRRLQDSGHTFDDVYDGTRKELARRYLGDPALSIQETAHLLAFVDLRGFYRAFRRWEGCTPAEFRRRVRDGDHDGAPGP
jgi:AraC-like DNA-binding protein